MRHVSLVRSSGFRLAMTFCALFLIASIIAGTTAYSVIREELVKRHQRVLGEQFDFLVSAYGGGDIENLRLTIEGHSRVSRNKDSVFLLQDFAGKKLAGNITTVPGRTLEGQAAASALGIEADYTYFVKQGEIGEYYLTIATSAEDISELEEIMLLGAAWAAVVLLAISLAGGMFLARSMDRRIARIQDGLERVSDGDFSTRIATSTRGDDIDTLTDMMNSAISRLGASVEGMRQISNDISHDLKSPLARLRITVEQAAENHARGISVAPELEEATAETDRIIATFDALLRIAQIETGARKARFASTNIIDVVTGITDFYQTSFEDAGMGLNVNLPAMIPPIVGDKELLTQLIANLLENALRHCPSGARIVCAIALQDDAVVLMVSDNGSGIPLYERDKVLRRLYRLEKSRTTPGSGLGLSLVKAISDLHGASLSLEDNEPGLRVVVRFPLAAGGGAATGLR
ncbi:HAMP domain-containing sensor histidine kinase [Hoeflea sp. AS60]|uniref:sensor histidine kinase n=1 Tax=Hoeflea sp. AS60 TaxID=3135780 RepID=UPI00317E3895